MSVTQEQPRLLPDQPPVLRMTTLDLVDLPPDTALHSPAPDPDLLALIRAFGVWEPVKVRPTGDGWKVIDGRRRIKASRLLGLVSISALVATGDFADEVVTVGSHATRTDNIASDLEAIEALLGTDRGDGTHFNERDVADATGLGLATLRKRLRLAGLAPALRAELASGRLKRSVAESAAKRAPAEQARLVALLDAGKRVTQADVDDLRQATAAQAIAAFDFGTLTATPDADEDAPPDPPYTLPADAATPLTAAAVSDLLLWAIRAGGLNATELEPKGALGATIAARIGVCRVFSINRPGDGDGATFTVVVR